MPLVKMFRDAPKELVLGSLAGATGLFLQGLGATFLVPYIVKTSAAAGDPISRSQALMMNTAGSVIAILMMPALAWVSDRQGRRPTMMAGGMVSVVGMWACFSLIDSANHLLVWIGFVALVGLVQPSQYGPIGAFLSEKSDPDHRYTGAGMTFQMASIIGAGTAPLVAGRLVTPDVGLQHLAIYGTVLFAISTLAIYLSKETAVRQGHRERFIEEAVFEA